MKVSGHAIKTATKLLNENVGTGASKAQEIFLNEIRKDGAAVTDLVSIARQTGTWSDAYTTRGISGEVTIEALGKALTLATTAEEAIQIQRAAAYVSGLLGNLTSYHPFLAADVEILGNRAAQLGAQFLVESMVSIPMGESKTTPRDWSTRSERHRD